MDKPHKNQNRLAALQLVWLLFGRAALSPGVAFGASIPCSYDVELLWGQTCGFFGPANVFVADIAQDGTIVGSVEQCADPALDDGFIWPATDGSFLIPRPTGVASLYTTCINDMGWVGVFMSTGFGGHVYDLTTGTFTPIGVPPGGNYSIPHGINDHGFVVGEWGNNLVGPSIQAFLWDGAKIVDLTPSLTTPQGIAWDINNSNQVTGYAGVFVTFAYQVFLWHEGKLALAGPIPGGTNSSARDINETGQIAVNGSIPNPSGSGTVGRPFLWDQGVWTELGILPGYAGCGASDINDNGQIIGTCTNPGTTDESWYLWQEGAMTDLAPLIPPDVEDIGIEVDGVIAINNIGQIAANGTAWHPLYGPSRVGLRLTPKFHSPADFTGDCHVDGADLAILLKSWGPIGKRNVNPAADLDGSGIVNGFDLGILLGMWG